jgi:hypothetical protein
VAETWTYTPCGCPKCAHRPVHGVCRCRVCGGEAPGTAPARTEQAQKDWAIRTAGVLLATEDRRPLTDLETIRLETALDLLTRSD